jgi:uncharacterized protein (TIGR02117 family)
MLSSRLYPSWITMCLALCVGWRCVSAQGAQIADGPVERDRHRTVYINQTYYHTGIIIELDAEARRCLEVSSHFTRHRYVDIGWGDEVFYQDPEFTLCKAARAILIPTSSVVRVEGFDQDVQDILASSDRAMKISITKDEFAKLCEFINGSLKRDADKNLLIASVHDSGNVIFFKSPYSYDLFNTCNTWIARAFKHAGLGVSSACVVTAGTLFHRLAGIGMEEKKGP